MPRTQLPTTLIADETIVRADLNVSTSGSAVIRKLIQGTGITISSTGVDTGTGDVTVSINSSSVVTSFNTRTGVVTLTSGDVTTALGFTPISGYTETDPVYTASSWYSTANNSSNWDTAYNQRIDNLTTVGTSGPATLIGNILNIPDYSGGGVTINNNTSGYIMTGSGTANTLNGQSNLVYSSNTLTFGPNSDNNTTYTITTRNQMVISANTDAANDNFFTFLTLQSGSGSNISSIAIVGSGTNNYINFRTAATDRMRIFSTGNVLIQNGGTYTDAGFRFDVSGTSRFQGQVTTTSSITAASAIARGVYFNNTLVAAANNDALVALDIAPTYTPGAFTGVNLVALRLSGGTLRVAQLSADPTNAANGDIYYNTTTNKFRGRENGIWANLI